MEILSDPERVTKAGVRALTPDVPFSTAREILRSPRFQLFRTAAAHCARLRHAAMLRRQTAIARDNAATTHKAVNGLGEKVASIDAEIYFQMRAKYGEACWDDPEFVSAFLRDNPACRVTTTRGTKGQEYCATARHFRSNLNKPTSP